MHLFRNTYVCERCLREQPMLYIDFDINDPAKFSTFQQVYHLLDEIKPKEDSRPYSLWKKLIPPHAQNFIGAYYKDDLSDEPEHRWGFRDMVSYLQFGFEVNFDYLEHDKDRGRIGFSAYAFPYGGMDRFLMFLKAYHCIPTESYNGFEVIRFHWQGDFEYEVTEHPEETKAYKATWSKAD